MKLSLFLLIHTFCMQDSSFYKKVINFEFNDYFLVVNVKSDTYTGKVVVKNFDMFNYMSEKNNINEDEFKSLMFSKLIHKDTLILNTNNLTAWSFKIVPNVSEIAKYKFKYRHEFIDRYFYSHSLVSKETTTSDEQIAIIDKLFEWGIPCSIHHDSGSVMIHTCPD